MIVLGVDPGSQRTGYGAVETDGRRHRLLEMGALAPGQRLSLPDKLRHIHDGVTALIGRLRPDVLAVEDVFHAANTRTALVLGHVRGVVLLAGSTAGLLAKYRPHVPLLAFTPHMHVRRRLALHWGVTPLVMEIANSIDRLIANLEVRLMDEDLARRGEIIVIICGAPLDIRGRTNLMKIHRVGDVTRLDERAPRAPAN